MSLPRDEILSVSPAVLAELRARVEGSAGTPYGQMIGLRTDLFFELLGLLAALERGQAVIVAGAADA